MCAFQAAPLHLSSFVTVAKWLYVVHDKKDVFLPSLFLILWLINASAMYFNLPPCNIIGEKGTMKLVLCGQGQNVAMETETLTISCLQVAKTVMHLQRICLTLNCSVV